MIEIYKRDVISMMIMKDLPNYNEGGITIRSKNIDSLHQDIAW